MNNLMSLQPIFSLMMLSLETVETGRSTSIPMFSMKQYRMHTGIVNVKYH